MQMHKFKAELKRITATNLTSESLPSRNQRPYTGFPNKTNTGACLGFVPLNLCWDTSTYIVCNLYLFLIVFIVTFNNASGSIKRNNYKEKNNGRRYRLSISKKAREGQKSKRLVLTEQQLCTTLRAPGEGSPNFKWQRWSKDFLGFKIFEFGILLG